ncbi:NAD-dependent epimerase/dehydratase family protein [Ulvibacter litoralis]|uniref:Nucleoside-diphosphate-sugar epimerase n=1 Tax=Ulvibacter litoralis TaxID=227084 RepID=A0A1G7CTE3_9FLAO|nr:NAD-dependent epimerase/dehydratase family protein [Ulvibacter litoralis]GHC46333.1 NAD-dependent epimerase [Ulvibacter litoralis]SDE41926.1 Nucleoside-diphosphate-sugar epimerase [Ulvibacter litoralis]
MILVTGGTGLVGSHLLYFLLKNNESIRAIHRKSSNIQAVKKVFSFYTETPEETQSLFNKIEWVEADITEIPSLSEAFKNITKVYHCAAYISFDPKHYYRLKKINIEGTANVVNLCLSHKIEKMMYVSSIATLGKELNNAPISEATEWNPETKNSVYAITKYGAEMEVWRGTQEGLNAIIVNPGIILGSGYWNSGSGVILKSVAKGIPFYTPGGIGIVDVRDVVTVLISLMKKAVINERYILVGKTVSYKDFLTELATNLHQKPPTKKASKWLLTIFAALDSVVSTLFGTKRKLLKTTITSLYNFSIYDTSKIEKELNFTFTPYKETIARVATNYLQKDLRK